jgi:hypothetical protein
LNQCTCQGKSHIERQVFPGKLAPLVEVWERVDDALTNRQLTRDVKTIYVSYTDTGRNLVAAVHPDPVTSTIEVALSLPPDQEHELTYDATHLKWRTLSLAIRLGPGDELTSEIMGLIQTAIEYAPSSVPRPSEDFEHIGRRGRYRA